jgi:hypothetical protein
MIMRGEEVKSRLGTGMWVQRYSLTASMLYLSWAEMGMMGAFLATVADEWKVGEEGTGEEIEEGIETGQ